MSERVHGRITNVWTDYVSTTLTQDEAAAATVLHVDDVAVFNDDGAGGSLLVGAEFAGGEYVAGSGQVIGYTEVDDDASTVTLAAGLSAAASEDDSVHVWSDLYGEPDTRQWAAVQPEGGDRADDIDATVADDVELVDGDRGKRGESCTLYRETGSDVWELTRVHGRPSKARGPKWESNDPHTLTAGEVTAGTFTHTLLHSRIVAAHEFTAYVNGVALGPDRYTLDADKGVVTVTLGGWETTADNFRFHYAYRSGPVEVPPTLDGLVLRGYVTYNGQSTAPLPAGSQVGDLVVAATGGGNYNGGQQQPQPHGANPDPRLTGYVLHEGGEQFWGTLTDLSALSLSSVDQGTYGDGGFVKGTGVSAGTSTVVVAVFGDLSGQDVGATLHTTQTRAEVLGNVADTITSPATAGPVVGMVMDARGYSYTAYSPSEMTWIANRYVINVAFDGDAAAFGGVEWTQGDPYQVYDQTLTVLKAVPA